MCIQRMRRAITVRTPCRRRSLRPRLAGRWRYRRRAGVPLGREPHELEAPEARHSPVDRPPMSLQHVVPEQMTVLAKRLDVARHVVRHIPIDVVRVRVLRAPARLALRPQVLPSPEVVSHLRRRPGRVGTGKRAELPRRKLRPALPSPRRPLAAKELGSTTLAPFLRVR